ncbi:hypothetical protein ACEWBT_21660 [Vibrio parahaemolyticus]|uniref:hypothetical protein n=1 Tax=Vibrio harveyi group TaxID=717610 RepID=UPI000C869BDA|nr:hypothetical protein [Vibrio parahaemolyticus]QLK44796.1 hypothetical protein DR996_05445 [Vibrio owensii]AYO02929.1 hypothetical protein D0871_00390 [Vibrio parahaemolyticus]EHK0753069.1 hypothetical protein [Vibrio parahaemolyticus]EHR5320126.1 hypothetical protein [Vibrio parahaemolyticus]EJB8454283.1 hypothetical protein [Vibrio parahaemolyticus]
MTTKTDFQFTLALAQDFFKQPEIQQRLQLITQRDITGWEIWFQVEFACFIDEHEEIDEWYREWQYTVDRRRTKTRQYMAIDFAFRRKRTSKDWYIALEVKQSLNATQCIHNMFKDVDKVWLMKSSEDDLRSIWCLGIHPTTSQNDLQSMVEKYSGQYGFELDAKRIHHEEIEDTAWSFTLL